MVSNRLENEAFTSLKRTMDSYAALSAETWLLLRKVCRFRTLEKNEVLYPLGVVPGSFSYVYRGLFRTYVINEKGKEYNKNFFAEGSFPGSMAALLTASPSQFSIDALEPSAIVEIAFKGYRALLLAQSDLKLFHIHYLEKHWLLAKDAREIEIVQQDATQRYQRFLQDYAAISTRLPQYLIASHLGITPTQLSRIRKKAEQP